MKKLTAVSLKAKQNTLESIEACGPVTRNKAQRFTLSKAV